LILARIAQAHASRESGERSWTDSSGVLRVVALPLAWRLPDPRAKSLVFLVTLVGTSVRQRLNTGWLLLSAPWRRR
jgi:hypothetical protein